MFLVIPCLLAHDRRIEGGTRRSSQYVCSNSIPAIVLFDSGASHSFIYLKFRKGFNNTIGDLDNPLRVEIVDDRTVKASKIYHSCTLRIYDDSFLVNLIPIPVREINVIVCMDWLNQFDASINYRKKIVRVQTPSRGELTIQGKGSKNSLKFYSAARAKKYLQHGYEGFLAYAVDNRKKKKEAIKKV